MSDFVITKVTAFVGIDPVNGDEAIWGFLSGNTWTPMICADPERIALIMPVAEEMSAISGRPYKIIQFSTREDVTDQVKEQYLKK